MACTMPGCDDEPPEDADGLAKAPPNMALVGVSLVRLVRLVGAGRGALNIGGCIASARATGGLTASRPMSFAA